MVQQLIDIWYRLTWSQRGTIFLFGFLGFGMIGGMVFLMNRVEYKPLFHDLRPEDAQAIMAKLDEENIKYKIEGPPGSTTIKVSGNPEQIALLRVEIAGSGIAGSGSVGFEIFDRFQFGMTDFTEHINLQRALEGALSRSLSGLAEISRAQVHIVLPKESVYEDRQEEAKASVIVRLKVAELSRSSIAGIKGIVAGAVPGLRTRNVSIVDDVGRLLTNSSESGDSLQTETQTEYRQKLEDEIASNVISILEPLVGKGKVRAVASIDMDFNTPKQMSETYDPDAPAISSRQESGERIGPVIPGNTARVPGPEKGNALPLLQSAGSLMEQVRKNESKNIEVSTAIPHNVQPEGTIRRVSVAVVLDHKTVFRKEEDGTMTETLAPRSREDLDKYRDVVLAAVGYDEGRGDLVTIINDPFYSETRPVEPTEKIPFYINWQEYLIPTIKFVVFVVLFLIVYTIFLHPIRKRLSHALSAAALETGLATEMKIPADEEGAALREVKSAGELGIPPVEVPEPRPGNKEESYDVSDEFLSFESCDKKIERELMTKDDMVDLGGGECAEIKKKLIDKARKDPEMVSQLIRSVLRERI